MAIKDAKFRISAEDTTDVAFRNVRNSLRGVESAASMVTGALGTLGIAFGGVQVLRFGKGLIDDADAMSKLAQKTNMGVEQVAGWSHALDLAGVSQEALQKTAKSLGTQMLDASMGLLESKRNFAALDIDIKNTDGSLKSVNAVLLEVADRYARATDKTAAAALMNKLLGKSALDLIPAFKDGRAALEAWIEEGKRLNPLTGESARQAEVFNDNVQRLSKSIKSGFIASMNEALPRLAAISEEFSKAAMEGDVLWAVMRGLSQAMNWSDPALVKQQKELIALAERREEINTNIERLRAKGPQWAEPIKQQMGELAKLDARAKALSAMIDPVNPRNYDARDLALVGNKPAFTPNITGTTGAGAAAKKAAAEQERIAKDVATRAKKWEDDLAKIRSDALDVTEGRSKNARELQQKGDLEAFIERANQRKQEIEAINDLRNANFDAQNAAKKVNDTAIDMGFAFSSAFEDAILEGKDLREVLAGIAQDIARIALRTAVTKPLGTAVGNAIGSINWGKLIGFASGGSFTVGGAGGTDSSMVSFMATPGERVSVQTPGQQGAGGGGPVFNVDMRGASVEAVARLERLVVAMNGSIERRAIGAALDHRTRNPGAWAI